MYLRKIFKNSRGATAIEYGLIAALIAVAAIAAMKGLGTKLSATFNKVSSNMSGSDAGAGSGSDGGSQGEGQ